MRLIFLTAAIAALVNAQTVAVPPVPDSSKPTTVVMMGRPSTGDPARPPILIQGRVVDKDFHAPIPGATVTISSGSTTVVRTNDGGDFQVRMTPGTKFLLVTARAAGYEQGASVTRRVPDGDVLEIELGLAKLQTVSGILVDDETRKPIPALQVIVVDGEGKSVMSSASGPNGAFVLRTIPQGEYFLRIADQPRPLIREIPAKVLEGDGRDKALEVPEGAASYATIVWPGTNADIPKIPGIKVGGAPVDLGEIRLTKTKLQNLSGLVGPCEEGARIQLNLSAPEILTGGMLATGDITCGGGLQLLNIPDGTFTLAAVQGFPQRRYVSQTVDARTRGPLRLSLAAFVTLQISVQVDGGMPGDVPPVVRMLLDCQNPNIKVDSPTMLRAGEYEATLYPGERYSITPQAGSMYYLKNIVYNGSTSPDLSGFTASTAPLSQITLVLSPRAATIDVRLTERGDITDASGPVSLVREGMSFAEFRKLAFRSTLDGSILTFPGLPPGTYRAVRAGEAIPVPTTEAAFQAMLADATRQSSPVTVGEGQSATITWDLP